MTSAPPIDVDRLTSRALEHTVQEFPPPINAGAFLVGEVQRGPLLPAFGTKERDRMLRIYDRAEQNGIWQGAIAGLIKRVRSTPWEIKGDPYWANYYQAVFQHAQYGKGWGEFISLILRDYFTQDYGAFIELIGPGEATGPITGPLGDAWRHPTDQKRYYGIAHKDSWRCYVTGNPTWPIVYYSLMTGALHRMHHSRIRRLVDTPDADERYFGIGQCALSRAIGTVSREIRMGRYIDAFLDDKPKPGINVYSGLTDQMFADAVKKYVQAQRNDDGALFGKVLNLFSMDVGSKLEVQSIPFAQTPEHFDFLKYVSLDVDSIALAIGVDRQDIWELAGRGLGSGSQSTVLAQKSESKAYGDILQSLERMFNNEILPPGLTLRFKTKNTVGDSAQAAIDVQYSTVVTNVAAIPDLATGSELRQLLSNKSETFANAFTDEKGSVELDDSDVQLPSQEVTLADDAPPEADQAKPIEGATKPAAAKAPALAQKETAANTGAMIALFLPDDAAQALYSQVSPALLAAGVNPVPPEMYHITLVNLGEAAQIRNARRTLETAITSLSDEDVARNPISGQINGIGRFTTSENGSTNAVYASFDAVDLPAFRAQLLALANGIVGVEQNHGFIPHITLAYLPIGMATPNIRLTPIDVRLEQLALALGDDRKLFDLDGDAYFLSKEFQDTRDEFIDNIVSLLSSADQTSRRRFGVVFRAQLRRLGQTAFQDGLRDGGVNEPLDDDDLTQVQHWMIGQSDYVSKFADQVYRKGLTPAEVADHAAMWANKSLQQMYDAGRLSADRNGVYEWVLGRTEKHCETCERLEGQRHRFKQWYARGLLPRSEDLDCGGYRCDCKLIKTDQPARGRF